MLTGLAGLIVWESAWRAGWIDPLFFSGPIAVAAALGRLVVRLENIVRLKQTIESYGAAGPILYIVGYVLAVVL